MKRESKSGICFYNQIEKSNKKKGKWIILREPKEEIALGEHKDLVVRLHLKRERKMESIRVKYY